MRGLISTHTSETPGQKRRRNTGVDLSWWSWVKKKRRKEEKSRLFSGAREKRRCGRQARRDLIGRDGACSSLQFIFVSSAGTIQSELLSSPPPTTTPHHQLPSPSILSLFYYSSLPPLFYFILTPVPFHLLALFKDTPPATSLPLPPPLPSSPPLFLRRLSHRSPLIRH